MTNNKIIILCADSMKSKYRKYCEDNADIPVFAQPWYLDIVTDGNWDAVISEDSKGEVQGVFAYMRTTKYGVFRTIRMPKLTPYLFILFKKNKFKNHYDHLNYKLKNVNEIIENLPASEYVRFFLSPDFSQCTSINHPQYSLNPRYTYILNDIKNHDEVWNSFGSNVRNHISNFPANLEITESDDPSRFYDLVMDVFTRQDEKEPYSRSFFLKLDGALNAHHKRVILAAKDKEGNLISAIYLVFDLGKCYCIATGTDQSFRGLNPLSKLYWEGIKNASKMANSFNFCGSMIPGIERMFRSFNGSQTLYLSTEKASPILKTIKGF